MKHGSASKEDAIYKPDGICGLAIAAVTTTTTTTTTATIGTTTVDIKLNFGQLKCFACSNSAHLTRFGLFRWVKHHE